MKNWAAKGIIKCPACGKIYEYCHGLVNTPYFRHKDKCDCDRFSEPETEEHCLGKRKLYDWICEQDGVTDAVLEGWISETHQRPDIMFRFNGAQYVIEYQCNPIATEFIERHRLYQSGGIKDIWVLGAQNYLNYASDKYNKDRIIEKTALIHYDSINNLVLYRDIELFKEYLCLVDESRFEKIVSSIDRHNFGLLKDKNAYVCVRLDSLTFNQLVIPSDTFYNSVKAEREKTHDEITCIAEYVSDILFKKINSRHVSWRYSDEFNEVHCKFKLLNNLCTKRLNSLEISICKTYNQYTISVFDKYNIIIHISDEYIESLKDRALFLDYQIVEYLKDSNYRDHFKRG